MKSLIQILNISISYKPFSLYIFVIVFFFNSILETFSISMLMPLIALILDPKIFLSLQNTIYSIYIPNFFFETSYFTLLSIISFAIILLYILKHFFSLFTVYLISTFVGTFQATLTNKLMLNYLTQNYFYHSKKKVSEINININQRVEAVAKSSVAPLFFIISEVLIIFSLIILIFISNQKNILFILSIFFIIGMIISKFLSKQLKKLGLAKHIKLKKKFETFSDLINNIREIILSGKKNFAFLDFNSSQYTISRIEAKFSTIQRIPYSLFEITGLLGLISSIFYLLNLKYAPVHIVAICTFFTAISFRIIPSLNKIIFFYYQIKYNQTVFNSVVKEINLKQDIEFHNEKISFQRILKLENIFFQYEKNKPILKNINLEIIKNSTIGIIGKSGSGKSTLLDIIAGLLFPTSGHYKVDDININNFNLSRKLQNITSYASQKVSILDGNLKKNICFGIKDEEIDQDKYEKVLSITMLKEFDKLQKIDETINDYGKNISGGQLQRIGIARALYFDKEIMIFDEATSSLDTETESKIIKNINDLNFEKTIIIVSHRLENLIHCEKIYKINDGLIYLVENE